MYMTCANMSFIRTTTVNTGLGIGLVNEPGITIAFAGLGGLTENGIVTRCKGNYIFE